MAVRPSINAIFMKVTIQGAILIFLSAAALFAVLFNSFSVSEEMYGYQLAALSRVEASMAKKWQESGGIKRELKPGSAGSDVTLLQYALMRDPAIYPDGRTTGYFGRLTSDALKRFQAREGIAETGILDQRTREKINNLYFRDFCLAPEGIPPAFTFVYMSRSKGISSDYVPFGLVDISGRIKTVGAACLGRDAALALEEMFSDAKKEGIFLGVTSGYRRPEIQQILYDFWISIYGERATESIARPGYSEHQLGTAVDLTASSIGYAGVRPEFADSQEGKWVSKNASKYGFLMSYPEGKERVTGYAYEPWHYRYVGREAAQTIREKKLTVNEWLAIPGSRPRPKNSAKNVPLNPRAFILVLVDLEGNEEVLAQKDADLPLPIASVTKLVAALAVENIFSQSEIISIPSDILEDKGGSGRFRVGDEYRVDDLLRALLIESNNDAAEAFAKKEGEVKFLNEMNEVAASLGLENSKFVSPSGLDGVNINRSSARDVSRVAKEIFQNHHRIASILGLAESEICTTDRSSCYTATTTNALLLDPLFPMRIKGGKTGDTPRAGKNLALAVEAPTKGWMLISVVLGSDDHFTDTKKVFEWAKESYVWP